MAPLPSSKETSLVALLVVAGDLGRLPRMQIHARMLRKSGYRVMFVGYEETPLPEDVECEILPIPNIKIPGIPKLFSVIAKVLVQLVCLLWLGFWQSGKVDLILVQNPPSLPIFMVAPVIKWWHGCKYIIDWHNTGSSIMQLDDHLPSWLAALAKLMEVLLGKFGSHHLTVSAALRKWLVTNHVCAGAEITILYDRPDPDRFRPLAPDAKSAFRRKFRTRLGWDPSDDCPLVVSSTSWTVDEDFGILLKALQIVDPQVRSMQLVITGKGPLKANFEIQFMEAKLQNIRLATPWLSFADYAALLGSADLGICLHISSSKMDLPMKLVDMLGCALPTLSFLYPAIDELIVHESNGFLFKDSHELAGLLRTLLSSPSRLRAVSEQIIQTTTETWSGQWNRLVQPLLKS